MGTFSPLQLCFYEFFCLMWCFSLKMALFQQVFEKQVIYAITNSLTVHSEGEIALSHTKDACKCQNLIKHMLH